MLQTGELPLTDKRGGRERRSRSRLASRHRPPMQSVLLGRAFGPRSSHRENAYYREWRAYLRSLKPAPRFLSDPLRTQYNVSVMRLRRMRTRRFPALLSPRLPFPGVSR